MNGGGPTMPPGHREWWGQHWPLVACAVLASALYTVWVGLHLGGERPTRIVDDVGDAGGAAVAVVLCALRARRAGPLHQRLGWGLVAAFVAALGTGDAIYAYYDLVLAVPVPYPSPADAAYLTAAALGVIACLVLVGPIWASSGFRALLDGLIIACALLVLSWLTVLHAVYDAGASEPQDLLISLTYASSDVVTAGIALSAISHTRQIAPDLLLFACGLLVFAVSDSLFTYLQTLGLYQGANLLDAGYLVGYLVIAIAASTPWSPPPQHDRVSLARWQRALPYGPFVLASLVLIWLQVRNQPIDRFTSAAISAVIALILLRQLAAVAEAHSLALRLDSTIEALEKALQGWKHAATEREILIENAPVGICRLDARGGVRSANRGMLRMLGYAREEMVGRPILDLAPAEDLEKLTGAYEDLAEGRVDHLAIEVRLRRKDGATIWCSEQALPVHDPAGRMDGCIAIMEDITRQRREGERAAFIQRQLLPQSSPTIEGYEVAGTCQPAAEVAGDFFDWVLREGYLDITLADVMGKGVGPALIMAALRTALRSADPRLGPAARIRLATDSLALGMEQADGLFVTLVQARLDLATGVLRYVDAGHGYCAVRRTNGRLVHLNTRSLPVGVDPDETFEEGEELLSPGDSFIVYSDGLVETPLRTTDVVELTCDLGETEPAEQMVRSLMRHMPFPAADDVTVLVLRRQPLSTTFSGTALGQGCC